MLRIDGKIHLKLLRCCFFFVVCKPCNWERVRFVYQTPILMEMTATNHRHNLNIYSTCSYVMHPHPHPHLHTRKTPNVRFRSILHRAAIHTFIQHEFVRWLNENGIATKEREKKNLANRNESKQHEMHFNLFSGWSESVDNLQNTSL